MDCFPTVRTPPEHGEHPLAVSLRGKDDFIVTDLIIQPVKK